MSYNPRRQQGLIRPRRERRLDPRAGVRHSDIVAGRGPESASIVDVRDREPTSRGWKVVIHRGDEFEMIYEYICARNATGLVKSEQDRAVRVLSGEIFVTVNGHQTRLHGGLSFSLPKNTEYEMATSGVGDVELIFCQGPNYEETLEQLTAPEAVNAQTDVSLPSGLQRAERVPSEQARRYAEQQASQRHQRELQRREIVKGRQPQHPMTAEESVQADAAAIAEAAEGSSRRPPRRPPLAGQTVIGVNPRPIGASGFGD